MKKIISVVVLANLFSFIFLPAAGFASVQSDIEQQLRPVQQVYGQTDTSETTFAETIAEIIKVVLGFLGIIFLVLIIYAGFLWMTAAGNEERIKKAKDIMIAAVIGVAIILAAYAITVFVVGKLLEATGVSPTGLNG